MKIAILGGGITGLAAAYYLSKKNHEVTIFEKEKVLGGLAVGFKEPGWEWPLERAYHHLFASDKDILGFAKEIGFNKIFFQSPETASLYSLPPPGSPSGHPGGVKTFPLDSPISLLRFPLLPMIDKIRAGVVLAGLKLSPFLKKFEKETAEEFLRKTMGERVWKVLWQELFRKKFGKYAGNILASFIWARIKVRTKKLGYIEGGFQSFIDYVEKVLIDNGVSVVKGKEVKEFKIQNLKFRINDNEFDVVISTLPTPVLIKVGEEILPKNYLAKLAKIKYLHALCLILETKEPILDKTYWLNICVPEFPFMVMAQHTNFIDKSHYGGNHLLYIGNYLEREDKQFKITAEELLEHYWPYLQKINPIPPRRDQNPNVKSYRFVGPFAQPIFDNEFLKNKPDFITPVKNFYIANLDMTYPQDRGTNFAVKLGREVATIIESASEEDLAQSIRKGLKDKKIYSQAQADKIIGW